MSPPTRRILRPIADIQYAGVAYIRRPTRSDVRRVDVGPMVDARRTRPFNIYVDTNNDGTWDRIIFNSNTGTMN